jgi:hypothetical protein
MPFAETLRRRLHGRAKLRHFKRLELHVTHACNLTCESCSHYSNHNHSGHLALDEADSWMGPWSRRLALDEFQLLGGEPTIHPELCGFVRLVRKHWPETAIRIRTNGFFLHRHPDLPALLAADGNAAIVISVHHASPEYRERLRPTFELIERWRRDFAIQIDAADSFTNWTRRYHGFGETMRPFEDNAPRVSWEICPAKYKQLFKGKIWKCAPLAYLKMQKAKYPLSPKWDFYLSYQPLDPDCSDRELDRFLAKEDEPHCAMCSGERRSLTLPLPIRSLPSAATQ